MTVLIKFPPERVIDVNQTILENEPGLHGAVNMGLLEGALGRIDNAILYEGLEDVFSIAAKYASAIANGHAFSDANKRTGLAVCLDYLAFNDFDLNAWKEHPRLADAMVMLVTGELSEEDFAGSLYALHALASYEEMTGHDAGIDIDELLAGLVNNNELVEE